LQKSKLLSFGKLNLYANICIDNKDNGIACITVVKFALDTAKEWQFKKNNLYLQLASSDQFGNHVIEIITWKWIIDLSPKKHIRIENIATFGEAVDMN